MLHDREVTYAVIAPEKSELFPGGILDNYRVIAEALKSTICSLGIEARLVPGRSSGAAGIDQPDVAAVNFHVAMDARDAGIIEPGVTRPPATDNERLAFGQREGAPLVGTANHDELHIHKRPPE